MPNDTVRASAIALPILNYPDPARDFVEDPSGKPDQYAMYVNGTCLEPEILNGASVLIDRTQWEVLDFFLDADSRDGQALDRRTIVALACINADLIHFGFGK
jgi:hypothetical protein